MHNPSLVLVSYAKHHCKLEIEIGHKTALGPILADLKIVFFLILHMDGYCF